jgi:phosphoglycolate phosphatase
MSFRLIVFDWDGTLMDSEAKITDCIQAAFCDLGEQPPSREASRNIIGLGLSEAMFELWPDADEGQRECVVERYRHHFLGSNETPSALFPGARELLDWLWDRDYMLAVATGKSRRGLNAALQDTGLADRFHATRCADETSSKPHPQMLLEIMDELGMRGSDTLMVGDTEYDMQMAQNAGTGALAVCYGVHGRERLLRQRPLGCIETIQDIRPWFEGPRGPPRKVP